MARTTPLKFDEVLAESRRFNGGLGILVFALIRALRQAGTDETKVAEVIALLKDRFALLSDADCRVLCDVAYARMEEERLATKGVWYN